MPCECQLTYWSFRQTEIRGKWKFLAIRRISLARWRNSRNFQMHTVIWWWKFDEFRQRAREILGNSTNFVIKQFLLHPVAEAPVPTPPDQNRNLISPESAG